jgi:hypothetical protein
MPAKSFAVPAGGPLNEALGRFFGEVGASQAAAVLAAALAV